MSKVTPPAPAGLLKLTVKANVVVPLLPSFKVTSLIESAGCAETVNVNIASVVKPHWSVARIVIVCVPAGIALLIETTPVVLLTEIVPV